MYQGQCLTRLCFRDIYILYFVIIRLTRQAYPLIRNVSAPIDSNFILFDSIHYLVSYYNGLVILFSSFI